jgi:uncharacterized OB-fold protein
MTEKMDKPFTAAAFNQFLAEKKLMAVQCPQCDATYTPPRAICPRCYSGELIWKRVSGKGNLVAFTSIHIAPTFMIAQGYDRDKPYLTGIIELEEGPKISARLLGFDALKPDQIQIGTPMSVDFIEYDEGEQKKIFLAFQKSES